MAERNPPTSIQAGSHSSENDRLTYGGEIQRAGVEATSSLAVSAPGGMNVRVAAGWACITGTSTSTQGKYEVYNDANVDKAVSASDPTNPRIDLVVAEIIDDAYIGGGSSLWRLRVVAGTPAASPVAPATPASSLVLAQVTVPAAAASIVGGNITDTRKYASALGGVLPTTSADLPTLIRPGSVIYEADTKYVRVWDGTAWQKMGRFGLQTFTPVLTAETTNPTLGTSPIQIGEFVETNDFVVVWVQIRFGTSGAAAGTGRYHVAMPKTMKTTMSDRRVGTGVFVDNSLIATALVGVTQWGVASAVGFHYPSTWPQGLSTDVDNNDPWTWANNDYISFWCMYPVA